MKKYGNLRKYEMRGYLFKRALARLVVLKMKIMRKIKIVIVVRDLVRMMRIVVGLWLWNNQFRIILLKRILLIYLHSNQRMKVHQIMITTTATATSITASALTTRTTTPPNNPPPLPPPLPPLPNYNTLFLIPLNPNSPQSPMST